MLQVFPPYRAELAAVSVVLAENEVTAVTSVDLRFMAVSRAQQVLIGDVTFTVEVCSDGEYSV